MFSDTIILHHVYSQSDFLLMSVLFVTLAFRELDKYKATKIGGLIELWASTISFTILDRFNVYIVSSFLLLFYGTQKLQNQASHVHYPFDALSASS